MGGAAMASGPSEWKKYFRDAPCQPGDEKQGAWRRPRLLSMDRKFVARVERALENGGESAAAAKATVDPARGLRARP